MGFYEKLIEWLRESSVPAAVIALASGLLLFLPYEATTRLGTHEFTETNRGWVGATFVLSISFFMVQTAVYFGYRISSKYKKWLRRRSQMRKLIEQIPYLTQDEKQVLSEFVDSDAPNVILDTREHSPRLLEANGYIFAASAATVYGTGLNYRMRPRLWEYLQSNPEVLSSDAILKDVEDPAN